jgi:PAS domain S-box-containing protein
VNLNQLNRILLQTMLLPVVFLLLVAGLLVWQVHNAEQTVERIQVADRNIATANLINALMVDEETGIRGYQNTANEIFLQPYEFAINPLQDAFASLRAGIDAEHGDTRSLDELVAAHQRWVETIAEPMIDTVHNGGNTRDPGANLRGKAALDNLRSLSATIIDTEKQQSALAVDHWKTQVSHTLYGVVAASLISGFLIGAFARNRLHAVTSAFQGTLLALRDETQITYQSEQRLLATLTSIGDGVLVCNSEGCIELLNSIAEQLTGWSQTDALNQAVQKAFVLVDETSRESLENPFDLVKRSNGLTGTLHGLLVQRESTVLQIDCSGAPIHDHFGTLLGVVIVFRDVTEQRRTQAALVASEKLAVAGRLAATIAHEIHNPLDAVVNLLYLMKSGSTPEETQQFLQMASSELDRVTQISRAMLGLYRESRTPVALELKPIIESVLVLLERQLAHAQITVKSVLPDTAIITGYPAELRQVFTNLIANAADASAPGSTIEILARIVSAPHGRGLAHPRAGVAVIINDHGTGITPADLDRIFQPYFTTKGEQGTGLGLWVSHGIIQKHGGSITVESRTEPEDQGTTITVFLPRGEAELPATT